MGISLTCTQCTEQVYCNSRTTNCLENSDTNRLECTEAQDGYYLVDGVPLVCLILMIETTILM